MKKSILKMMILLGLAKLALFFRRNSITIFSFHQIIPVASGESLWPLRTLTDTDHFKLYMLYIQRYFLVVTLDEALDMLEGRSPLRQYSAVITFDDGYRDNHDVLQRF